MKHSSIKNDHLSRMAEPDDLRELRNQAERIERKKRDQIQAYFYEAERRRLRDQIRDAGEVPCR